MSKMTLLEMVRNILAALDEDDVDNIDDTPSAQQITEVLKEVYFQFVQNDDVPELQQLFRLSDAPAGENTILTVPTTIAKVDWIKYNRVISGETRQAWGLIRYLTPEEFINLTDARDSTASDSELITDPTSTNVTYIAQNNKAPEYWTSFNDNLICFDSYDAVVDTAGVVASKTKCFGQAIPVWTGTNDFIPTLDANKFPYLLAEAKAVCFSTLNKSVNLKIEQVASQQKAKQQNNNHRFQRPEYRLRQPDYGRKSPSLRPFPRNYR